MTGLGAAMQVLSAIKDADVVATVAHTAATVAGTVASGAMTAAQWLLNAAMSANPIMLVVLALAALVAAVILAYTHCDRFRAIVDAMGRVAVAAFGAVVNGASAAFGWISAHWPLLLAILTGPFGLAVFEIAKHWDSIVSTAASIPGRITGALGNVGNILYGAGKSIIEGLGRGIEDALTGVLDKVSGIAGKIASLKGPLDVDRRLLVPHGAAIMQGLHEGLSAGLADVNALVSSVAPRISANVAPAAAAGRSGPAVLVENAHFASDVDVDAFMRRAAWAARTSRL
jgi:phage-related protein